ncbi:MAG: hypothetical protein P8Z75_14835 [Gammaproteobacteria bacterium]
MLRLRIVIVLLCLAVSGLASAKTIEQYLGHVKTLTARFTQYVFNESTGEPKKSEGRLYVASPCWRIHRPSYWATRNISAGRTKSKRRALSTGSTGFT